MTFFFKTDKAYLLPVKLLFATSKNKKIIYEFVFCKMFYICIYQFVLLSQVQIFLKVHCSKQNQKAKKSYDFKVMVSPRGTDE